MNNKFEIAKQELKKTFYGIDEQIDQVIKAFETWESIKDYQVRPMTVCLWGLTGTGKTALLNKTIELLDLNKKKFYIKFGTKTSGLACDFELNECKETIFILDEFQYFKTKRENGEEIERDEDNSTNLIWELLDGGLINLYGMSNYSSYEKYQLYNFAYNLRKFDNDETTYKNGIIENKNLLKILKEMSIEPVTDEEINDFLDSNYTNYGEELKNITVIADNKTDNSIPIIEIDNVKNISKTRIPILNLINSNWYNLYEYIKGCDIDYNFNNKNELISFILDCPNIESIAKFITEIKNSKQKSITRDYSKSLIFVIGNLDECFTMANNLNSDLDADYFYNKTKKINIVDVRRSLLNRFRAEQIARLGSTHIIYPSLNKEAFNNIIKKELESFKQTVLTKFNENVSNVTFSDKIIKLIYKEGVFPIIGARSIFSVVNEIITDKFNLIIKEMLTLRDFKDISINFDYIQKKSLITISFCTDTEIKKIESKYVVKIDNLRNENNKGKQTHIAVHEAGHAIASIALEKIIPEVIYSVILDNKNSGFNLFDENDMYYETKKTYINKIACLLSGYVAEELVFGVENVSNGSSSDISKATSLLASLFKDCGFSNSLNKIVSKSYVSTIYNNSNYSLIGDNNEINDLIVSETQKAKNMALDILQKENILFLKVAEYLSKNPKMSNIKLKQFIKRYAKTITVEEISEDKQKFYTDKLNKLIKNLNE